MFIIVINSLEDDKYLKEIQGLKVILTDDVEEAQDFETEEEALACIEKTNWGFEEINVGVLSRDDL